MIAEGEVEKYEKSEGKEESDEYERGIVSCRISTFIYQNDSYNG